MDCLSFWYTSNPRIQICNISANIWDQILANCQLLLFDLVFPPAPGNSLVPLLALLNSRCYLVLSWLSWTPMRFSSSNGFDHHYLACHARWRLGELPEMQYSTHHSSKNPTALKLLRTPCYGLVPESLWTVLKRRDWLMTVERPGSDIELLETFAIQESMDTMTLAPGNWYCSVGYLQYESLPI